ncbi:unnamed protein product [Pleuronectes platessa]|uniref:Dystonin n=1 Tax=Pleuronectes platessa TaxID=8262 RepID=A0A9N7W038_PLEPL|nr:unnamed protein product [Pleuronectes platessa]
MIAAAFLVLLRPYSIQCVLLLLLLLLGTIATILFFCCWHRRLRNGKHPIKSVLSGRAKSRAKTLLKVTPAVCLTFAPVSQGFRHSPRHAKRSLHARVTEEKPNLVEIPESEPDSSSTLRKRKVKKRVLPEFYQSVQVTPTRKPVAFATRNYGSGCPLITTHPPPLLACFEVFGAMHPAPSCRDGALTPPWLLPELSTGYDAQTHAACDSSSELCLACSQQRPIPVSPLEI